MPSGAPRGDSWPMFLVSVGLDLAPGAKGKSFEFAGGGGCATGVGSTPSGPRGPRESSSASNVVDCVPKRRVVRAAFDGVLRAEGVVDSFLGAIEAFSVCLSQHHERQKGRSSD